MGDIDINKILSEGNRLAKNFNQFDANKLLENFKARQELSKSQQYQMYICESKNCINPAHIRVIAYEGSTGVGNDAKDQNDIYFCINHFNFFRKIMKVDLVKLNKRRDHERQQGIRK